MKKLYTMLLCAAMLVMAALPAFAAPYPSNVEITEDGFILKTYELSPEESPESIPAEDFERGGVSYTLVDMLRRQTEYTDSREHTELVSVPAPSANTAEALKLFAIEMEMTAQDGYAGILTLDHTTIQAGADGYKTGTKKISATRTYPNLSGADVSLIPKTVEENGRTLTLDNVTWQESGDFYTATASYAGTVTSKTATGYTATAEYRGTLTKTIPGPVIYTAIFEAAPVTEPNPSPEQEPEPSMQEPEAQQQSTPFYLWCAGLMLVLLAAYAVMRSRKKKKG